MNVQVAKSAGFCFGVKRAVNLVYDEITKENNKPIYTYGPIIHNDEVVKDMEKNGVIVIKSLDELASHTKGIIIIRSHGISRKEYEIIENSGYTIKDATCPFVKKIHTLAQKHTSEGEYLIIIGNSTHPEVQGIKGWVVGDMVSVVGNVNDIENLDIPETKKVCIVSQTTFNYNKFQELVEIIAKKGYDINVLNTICNATEERQTEARKIASESDAMIVIGDSNSSNTQKLFEICKKECENTYYIQTNRDMDYDKIKSVNNVGITAGASTPNNIIEEVSKNVRNEL